VVTYNPIKFVKNLDDSIQLDGEFQKSPEHTIGSVEILENLFGLHFSEGFLLVKTVLLHQDEVGPSAGLCCSWITAEELTPKTYRPSSGPVIRRSLLTNDYHAQRCHAFRPTYAIRFVSPREAYTRLPFLVSGTEHSVLARICYCAISITRLSSPIARLRHPGTALTRLTTDLARQAPF